MAKAEYRSAVRSRQLINAALADLLQEKSLDKITVTDVVRRAGINRGTFYAHYLDIPDVICHMIDKTFSHVREDVFEKTPRTANTPSVMLHRIQELLAEDLELQRKITNSSAFPLLQKKLTDTFLEYMFQHEDELGFGDHEQYVLALRFCAGGLTNLYRDWFAGEIPLTLDEMTDRAATMLQKMLDTQ